MNQEKPDRIWESTGSDYDNDGNEYTTWASHPRGATYPCGKCGAYCTAERLDDHEKNCK